MIDEEMAKRFADSHTRYIFRKRKDGTEYVKKVSDITIQQAFLAGLKAGRPVWHDLRKNPNELPKRMRKSILSRTVLNQIGTPCHYNYELECWQNWSYIEIDTPIAWGEIPTFDKE